MDGLNALRALVEPSGSGKQAELAREADCSEGHISLVLSGKKKLSVKLAKRISAKTGIPAAALLGLETAE